MDLEDAKRRVAAEVDKCAGALVEVSHSIHAKPELLFEERAAADTLAAALEAADFDVERGAYGLDTAFAGRRGGGDGPTVAVLCEYDALPGIGHACGHNIIAAAGLGAALAAGAVVDEVGGRLVVLGTPAEEGGGGKVLMGDRGAFEGVDAAMMVHPAGAELVEIDAIAIATWRVEYFGKAAHAAAFPDRGRNALDAAVLGYNAVAALRQHIAQTDRIHGVFIKGGDKPNIVPDHTVADWYVRSATIESLQPLKERVRACLEAGAAAAGCRMELVPTCPEYSDLRTNEPLAELYTANMAALGREVRRASGTDRIVGSTDMGNVSYWVPSIHPIVKVSPPDVAIHSQDFATWAASPDGDQAVVDGAKAMAMTAVDLWMRDDAMAAVRDAFIHESDAARLVISAPVHPYVSESWSAEEAEVLRRYFTNLDGPVFALVNLPEVVKGALFARYSRSAKSLRRLFLDEFVGELDMAGDSTLDATIGLARAEELYQRVFFEYGDDSVAQLGGVHLACEQASNLLTKVLEWGRLMAYLEQSTRYIAYDARLGGRFRYFRDPEILASALGTRYIATLDRQFQSYAELLPVMQDWFRARHPKTPDDSDFVYRQSIRAKALDALRGMLPAAALSNVGIYGTGQGYEMLLLRMRAHPLPEARAYADLMLTELRKVIPSFLSRVDLPDRGQAWSEYLSDTRSAMDEVAVALFGDEEPEPRPAVTLVDFDPDAEDKLLAAMLYPYVDLPEDQILARVRRMGADERVAVARAYVGDRRNRRHKPGRALERIDYRFDVCSDYGAFRDLQRHRLLTIEWQALSPSHGYVVPPPVAEAGHAEEFDDAMARSASLYDDLAHDFPAQAPYAVSLAYRLRYVIQMNAREAMHMIELRTTPVGHPEYRVVCQEMHRLIAEQAGHRLVAEMMQFVDHGAYELERLEGERRAEAKRSGRA